MVEEQGHFSRKGRLHDVPLPLGRDARKVGAQVPQQDGPARKRFSQPQAGPVGEKQVQTDFIDGEQVEFEAKCALQVRPVVLPRSIGWE